MSDSDAINSSPTCPVPLIVGSPVAGLFGLAVTVSVAALASGPSENPAKSVKLTFNLMVLPTSASARA